jgi:hypothetical protein
VFDDVHQQLAHRLKEQNGVLLRQFHGRDPDGQLYLQGMLLHLIRQPRQA